MIEKAAMESEGVEAREEIRKGDESPLQRIMTEA